MKFEKGSLLIADDDPCLLQALAETFAKLGHDVVLARDGRELLNSVLTNSQVVAVLSDIEMPQLTGIEVLKEMRSRSINTPLIFLTGYGEKDLVIEALRLGAFDFLEKPFVTKNLITVVNQAMTIGAELKGVETELAELAVRYGIKPEELETFQKMQRPLLLMKIKNSTSFGRKTG